jgi:hypothetical protein
VFAQRERPPDSEETEPSRRSVLAVTIRGLARPEPEDTTAHAEREIGPKTQATDREFGDP